MKKLTNENNTAWDNDAASTPHIYCLDKNNILELRMGIMGMIGMMGRIYWNDWNYGKNILELRMGIIV